MRHGRFRAQGPSIGFQSDVVRYTWCMISANWNEWHHKWRCVFMPNKCCRLSLPETKIDQEKSEVKKKLFVLGFYNHRLPGQDFVKNTTQPSTYIWLMYLYPSEKNGLLPTMTFPTALMSCICVWAVGICFGFFFRGYLLAHPININGVEF